MEDSEHERPGGEVPEGVGPEIFRERLEQVSRQHADDGAHITVESKDLYLEDIQGVEQEPGGGRSRIRLRNLANRRTAGGFNTFSVGICTVMVLPAANRFLC